MTKTILITTGPTREYIDPVRFISNASSGKMGKEIAQAAVKKGFNIIAVQGVSSDKIESSSKCRVLNVISAKQMFEAVKKNLKFADIFIGVAAVSDYTPVAFSKNKIKKNKNIIVLKLKKNPDIIGYAAKHKGSRKIIGFALETDNMMEYAKSKLKEKKLDMIVANGVDTISSEKSKPFLIFKCGKIKELKMSSKKYIAKEIINEITETECNKTGKNRS